MAMLKDVSHTKKMDSQGLCRSFVDMTKAVCSVALALCVSTSLSMADQYPSRPLTIVVPGAPGGATDALGRAIGAILTKAMGQPVIIENKAGANGMLAAQAVAQAKPDGYTLFVTHGSPIQNAPHMGKVPYNVRRDFAFIAQIGGTPSLLVVNKSVPANDMAEFLKWARANKGKLSYGSYGAGGAGHLMSAFLSQSRDLDMTHAAYKGEAQLIQDMIGGHVPWGIATMGSLSAFLESGQLRPLAAVSDQRLKELPNVPTMSEAGLTESEFKSVGWFGVLAPAATPAPILAELEKQVLAALRSPDLEKVSKAYALNVTGRGSAEFRKEYEALDPVVARLIQTSGVKQE